MSFKRIKLLNYVLGILHIYDRKTENIAQIFHAAIHWWLTHVQNCHENARKLRSVFPPWFLCSQTFDEVDGTWGERVVMFRKFWIVWFEFFTRSSSCIGCYCLSLSLVILIHSKQQFYLCCLSHRSRSSAPARLCLMREQRTIERFYFLIPRQTISSFVSSC